ncbi:YggS family pyridoxal phosphate-dependent enzyme [Nanoarchaeota archaeon]
MNTEKTKEIIKELADKQVILVAVTKTRTLDEINKAIELGITVIGENRLQEAQDKFPQISDSVEKHFIGHLQSNKVKKVVEISDMIESVDSIKLLKLINNEAEKQNKIIQALIEINIGDEETKSGIPYENAEEFFKEMDNTIKSENLKNIKILGLMTIAPFIEPEETRPYFKKMKALFDKLKEKYSDSKTIKLEHLSMGMSNDWQIAAEEGSNMVRLGTAIFGERNY